MKKQKSGNSALQHSPFCRKKSEGVAPLLRPQLGFLTGVWHRWSWTHIHLRTHQPQLPQGSSGAFHRSRPHSLHTESPHTKSAPIRVFTKTHIWSTSLSIYNVLFRKASAAIRAEKFAVLEDKAFFHLVSKVAFELLQFHALLCGLPLKCGGNGVCLSDIVSWYSCLQCVCEKHANAKAPKSK